MHKIAVRFSKAHLSVVLMALFMAWASGPSLAGGFETCRRYFTCSGCHRLLRCILPSQHPGFQRRDSHSAAEHPCSREAKCEVCGAKRRCLLKCGHGGGHTYPKKHLCQIAPACPVCGTKVLCIAGACGHEGAHQPGPHKCQGNREQPGIR